MFISCCIFILKLLYSKLHYDSYPWTVLENAPNVYDQSWTLGTIAKPYFSELCTSKSHAIFVVIPTLTTVKLKRERQNIITVELNFKVWWLITQYKSSVPILCFCNSKFIPCFKFNKTREMVINKYVFKLVKVSCKTKRLDIL